MASFIRQAFSPKAFILAMGGACLLYGSVALFSITNGAKTLDKIQSKMAIQNIAIEKPVFEPLTREETPTKSLEKSDVKTSLKDKLKISQDPLPPAPYDGLSEDSKFGGIPKIGENNLKPFDAYKKPVTYDASKPVIALGISGIGFSQGLYNGILSKLSPQASIILSIYVDRIDDIQKEARSYGYETWLELPFETKGFGNTDPGSKAILSNAGLKYNKDNYRTVLASTSGYAGIAGYTDAAFKDSPTMLNSILSDIFARGLGFLDMNTGRDFMSHKIAVNSRGAHIQSSASQKDKTFTQYFEQLKKIARRNKKAVGTIEITPVMLEKFQEQLLKAQDEGFQIVPLSALADQY